MPIIVQRYTIAEDVQSVPQAKPAGTGGDPLLELLAAADKCDHDAPNLPTTPTFSERRDGEHVSSLGGVRGGAGLTVEVESERAARYRRYRARGTRVDVMEREAIEKASLGASSVADVLVSPELPFLRAYEVSFPIREGN